jgi:hypothetical protein
MQLVGMLVALQVHALVSHLPCAHFSHRMLLAHRGQEPRPFPRCAVLQSYGAPHPRLPQPPRPEVAAAGNGMGDAMVPYADVAAPGGRYTATTPGYSRGFTPASMGSGPEQLKGQFVGLSSQQQHHHQQQQGPLGYLQQHHPFMGMPAGAQQQYQQPQHQQHQQGCQHQLHLAAGASQLHCAMTCIFVLRHQHICGQSRASS